MFCFLILIPTVVAFFPAPLTNISRNVTWYTIVEQVYTSSYHQWHLINSQVYSNLYAAVLQDRVYSGPMFSTSRPIGYGSCSSRSYLQVNATDICITTGFYNNGTSFGYSDCQAAVNATLVANTVPAQLPNLLPTLNNTLTCADYALPSSHSLCDFYSNWLGFNQTNCMDYASTHMGVCYFYYEPWYNFGSPQGFQSVEGYQRLNDYILWTVANNYSLSTGVQYRLFQSATQALLAFPVLMSDNITSYYICYCFCTTNSCNTNISTCSAGLPFNCTYSPTVGTTIAPTTLATTLTTTANTTSANTTTASITNSTTSTTPITMITFSNTTSSFGSNMTSIVSVTTTNSTSSFSTSNVTTVSSTTSTSSGSSNLTVLSTLGTTANSNAMTVAAEQRTASTPNATMIGLAVGIGLCGLLILIIASVLIALALTRRCKKNSPSTNKVKPEATASDVAHDQTTFDPQAATTRPSDPPLQSLQEPRRPVRTNRTVDLRTAAWMHNP